VTISRRRLLQFGGVAAFAAGAGTIARPARAAISAITKRVVLANLHTGEDLDVEFFRDRAYVPQAMQQIEHILRDFRTGDLHPIDPRLMDYLHNLAFTAGVDPAFSVISGYRSPATNAALRARSRGVARHSLHMQGRAIDVRLAGVGCADLATKALALRCGGVGYYRTSDFVHLDTGAYRTWRG